MVSMHRGTPLYSIFRPSAGTAQSEGPPRTGPPRRSPVPMGYEHNGPSQPRRSAAFTSSKTGTTVAAAMRTMAQSIGGRG